MPSMHAEHLNPEALTKAKFRICLFKEESFDSVSFKCDDICGGKARIELEIRRNNYERMYYLFAKISAIDDTQPPHSFKVSSSNFQNITNITLTTKPDWQLICFESVYTEPALQICNLTLELINEVTAPYRELYDDDFTDFELRDEDGASVAFHRNILAVSSPVLKTMLLGDWNEAKERHAQIPGFSKDTIQQFKDYLYLKKLPETPMDCVKLMNLGLYYIMPELQKDCVIQIEANFKLKDGWDWYEYFVSSTMQHKAHNLLTILLRNLDTDKIKALVEHFSKLATYKE